jgi:GxxExxY protein
MNTDGEEIKMDIKAKKAVEDLIEINRITEKIIGCGFKISNSLGGGFLEKVYENALAHELDKCGLHSIQQQKINVWYDGIVVGDYLADLIVEDCFLIELKSIKTSNNLHFAQRINYLKATRLKVCLLMNFGNPKMEFKRLIN